MSFSSFSESAAMEALSMVWMELAMFAVAIIGYTLFKNRLASGAIESKIPKDNSSSPVELVSRDLQRSISRGDDLVAFKLWHRLKSMDGCPQVGLSGVVRAMQRLGKPTNEIMAELRSAIECNESFLDLLLELLEDLQRSGQLELCAGTAQLLKEAGRQVPERSDRQPMATKKKDGKNSLVPTDSKGISPAAAVIDETPASPAQISPEESVEKTVAAIKSYGRQRDLRGAFTTFSKLKQSGVPMSPLIYNCLLDACIQCDDLPNAKIQFEKMKELNYADIVSYNTMIKAHLKAWRVDDAELLLREMVERGLVPNKVTFNELLAAKIAAKDRRGLWQVIEMMRLAKIAPNSVTCSTLLKALTEHSHANDVSRTMELLDHMEEAMDEVLFGAAAETCVRIRRLDLLTELRRKHVKSDSPLALTSPAYGSMIKAYGRVGDVDQLWELWNEMCELKLNPTAITVGCMVDALVKNDSVEGAWRLLHDLLEDEERRGSVNTVIYSTILKGFASAKQINKVFMVYKEMKERSVPSNTITFNTLLDACARGRAMDRVPQLLEDMKASSVEPDIITYSTIIKGYCMNGDVDRAFDVLADMRRERVFAPDEILYNSLLDGCVRQNRVEQALQLVQDMKDSGTAPSNYTLSILIKLLGRSRQLKQAFDLVEKLCSENGFRPNVQVYTCLMQACIQNRKLDRALEVHNTMILESGCQPDQMVYTVLARGCLQSGAMEQALKVIRCAYRLPGHDLATTSDRTTPPGIEAKLLAEIPSHIASSNEASKSPWQSLAADLKEHRGVFLALGSSPRRTHWRS